MYRLIEKLHLERYLNSRLILAIDLVVSGVASLCALVLVRLLLPPLSNISKFALLWIGCAVVYSFITFFLLKTYRSVIRHSTLREIAKFVVAVIGKEFLLGLTILLYPPTPLFGMHMLALLLFDLLLTLCGLILIRVAMIIVYDLVKNNLKSRKQHQLVLVYGLSEKSVSLVTRLQSSPHYKVVGFLTFGRRMKNHTIAECPVYYFENEYSIRYLRQRYDIDAVLFPTNEEAQTEQERLIRYCVESNLKILIAPPMTRSSTARSCGSRSAKSRSKICWGAPKSRFHWTKSEPISERKPLWSRALPVRSARSCAANWHRSGSKN